jgi:hypothetical protein
MHPLLNFKGWTDIETSEIEPNKYGNKKYISYFQNIKFIVYENESRKFTLCILGSIHKFFNNGMHNFNDFTYLNIVEVIDRLGEIFSFNIHNCKINLIEIGVNIIPPIQTKKVLKGLLSHRNCRFKSYAFDDAEYFQVNHTNFYFKIYDKAKQYRAKRHIIPNDILRIELKSRKMEDLINLLKSKGIIDRDYIVLSDFKNIDVLIAFGELLVKKWNEILFYDYTISKNNLSKLQLRKLDVWQNINQWEDFKRQKRLKQKNLLKNVINNHSQKLQLQVSNLIQEKLETLLQKGLPSNHFYISKKDDLLTTYDKDVEEQEGLPFDSILIESIGKPFKMIIPYKKEYSIIPDYEEFHNDAIDIPF